MRNEIKEILLLTVVDSLLMLANNANSIGIEMYGNIINKKSTVFERVDKVDFGLGFSVICADSS